MYNREWEENIKSGIKKGDYGAFRLLYIRFYPALCIFANRYTGKPEIAEEIVQQTFMKLWEGRKKITIYGNIIAYLSASVRNEAFNYLKHLLVEKKYSAETSRDIQKTINSLHISQEDGSSILISEEMGRSLQDALESLPPKCREIFLIHRDEGLKYSEIATRLGISQNTVQRQVSIALEKLRSKLLPIIKS